MFEGLEQDELELTSADGLPFKVMALWTSKGFQTSDVEAKIEEGQAVARKLPNGSIQRFRVVEVDFIQGQFGIPSQVVCLLEREKGRKKTQEASSGPVFQLSGNSRLNINSVDESTNSQSTSTAINHVRKQLRQLPVERQAMALELVDKIEESPTEELKLQRYVKFVSALSDHMTVLGPILPRLAEVMGWAPSV